MNVYAGLCLAKIERAADKVAQRQGYKLRYTIELREHEKIEVVKSHLDLDAAREYRDSQPCCYLLPTEGLSQRLKKLVECARERFFLGVCDRYDT